jgi:hypothetical protein
MSLEQISYLSQIIASVAVVGSLLYLAQQVRQAERNQRAMIQQGRADRTSAAALLVASPELATVFRKGVNGEPLTREEFNQFLMLARGMLLSGEDSYLQHKVGLLDERAFDSWLASARVFMAAPGLRAMWRLTSHHYSREFREFSEKNIVNQPIATGADAYAAWQQQVQAELK